MTDSDLRFDSGSVDLLSNTIATFSAIRNSKTGVGTGRNKTESGRVNPNLLMLSREELEVLPYQDELIGRAIWLYPMSAINAWFHVHIANKEGKSDDQLPDEIQKYLKNLGDREDATPEESEAEIYGAREAFYIASILAEQFGKAYILMGIDDGRDFSEPVDKRNIRSLRWLQVYDNWDIRPEKNHYRRRTHSHYRLIYGDISSKAGSLIHKSRLLPFYGNRIYSRRSFMAKGLMDDGISKIQGMFDAWSQWVQGEKAGSAMLADYDVFTLGMKGLALSLERDRREGIKTGQEAILNRALVLDQGKSTGRGIIYDLDNEKPDSLSRSYSGANDILENLERRWVAATGIPEFKLFGKIGGQGLTNNQGLAMRSEWAILSQVWSSHKLLGNFERLTGTAFLAKDSPSRGRIPEGYRGVSVPFNVPMTNTERMEFEHKAAERSEILTGIGAIYSEEVRTGYRGSEFSPDIILDESLERESQERERSQLPQLPQPDQPNQPQPNRIEPDQGGDNQNSIRHDASLLSDKDWEELAQVTAADFVKIAKDVADAVEDQAETETE